MRVGLALRSRRSGAERRPLAYPRQDRGDAEGTIGRESDVAAASFESFPASDAPGYTAATPDRPPSYSAEDARRARGT